MQQEPADNHGLLHFFAVKIKALRA